VIAAAIGPRTIVPIVMIVLIVALIVYLSIRVKRRDR
jgi:hypothetical protein